MKTTTNITTFLTATLLMLHCFSSCTNEPEGVLLKEVQMKIDFSAYQSLPKDSMPYTDGYFTPADPANKYLGNWLYSKYYSVGNGSLCEVSYNFRDYIKPMELKVLSNQQMFLITPDDYKLAWKDIESDFYSTDVPYDQSIPLVLQSNFIPDEGEFKIVEYNFSTVNPIILKNQEFILFGENFSNPAYTDWGVINTPQWFMKVIEGAGRGWSTILNKTASTPNAFSYNRTAGADNWLITKNAIDLSDVQNSQFSFDFGWGYYVANEPFRFEVLITESFDSENPMNSKWTDITNKLLTHYPDQSTGHIDEVSSRNLPSGGYPGLRNYILSDFSEFHGKKIYLAFRDKLLPVKTDGSTYSTASLYFLDNVKLTEKKDKAFSTSIEKRRAIFRYLSGKWTLADDHLYVLQPVDYPDQTSMSMDEKVAELIIPGLLREKFNASEGEKKIIVFTKPDLTTKADDYIFISGTWRLNAPPIIRKYDRYIFDPTEGKWVFDKMV